MSDDQVAREGCANSGQDYEYLLPALFALRLLDDKNVKDFTISSNVAHFGAFDDVVITITNTKNVIEKFAIQLKHKEAELQPATLTGKKGKLTLNKYLESFKNLSKKKQDYQFILYTTASFDDNHLRHVRKIETNDGPVEIKMIPEYDCPGKKIFNTCTKMQKPNCTYKFRVDEENQTTVEFFEKFTLFVRQKDCGEIENEIRDLLLTRFGSNNCNDFLQFFRFWHKRWFVKIWLTREEIKFHLIETLLPHIELDMVENESYVEKIVRKFDVILVESDEDFVKDRIKMRRFLQDDKIFLQLGKNYALIPATERKLTRENKNKILRFFGRLPYVMEVTSGDTGRVLKIISLCKNFNRLKFIFLGNQLTSKNFFGFKVLESLVDVGNKCGNLAKIFNDLPLIVEGRTVLVNELLEVNKNFAQLLTTDKLLLLLNNKLIVGSGKDDFFTLGPYIPRSVSVCIFSSETLNGIRDGLLVVSWNGNMELADTITKEIYCRKLTNRTKYISKCAKNTNSTKRFLEKDSILPENSLILTRSEDSRKLFQEIGVHGENVHHFKWLTRGDFEWIASKWGIEELKPLVNTSKDSVAEEEIFENFQGKTNVICASSGMGKSVMLRYLKAKCPISFWPLLIKLKEHQDFFSKPQNGNEILDHFLQNYKSFEKNFVDIYKENKQIVFLFDELDEIPISCVEFVLDGIKKLSSMGYVNQWLCSRPNYREILEKSFCLLTVDIKEFSVEQQQSYLRKRLEEVYNEEANCETINNIYKNFNVIKNQGIVGVPLQLYMITEILMHNRNKIVVGGFIVLTDMYQKFMEGKYLNYFKNKVHDPQSIGEAIDDATRSRFEDYKTAGVISCFGRKFLENFEITKYYQQFLKKIKDNGDILGIIERINDDDVAVFGHNTYAEFFAASWLVDNIKMIKQPESIFDERHKNVRYMLDMITGKACPVNIAVLYENLTDVERNLTYIEQNKKKIEFDKLGRSPLHIACSWGVPHVPFGSNSIHFNSSPKLDYIKIIKLLIKKCKIDEKCHVLKLTPIKYADRTFSLDAIEGISTKYKIDLKCLDNFKDIKTVVYHCIKNNYENLFKSIKKVPYFEHESDPLSLAVELERKIFVEKLIKRRKYRKSVNKKCLLHIAARQGNADLVKILMKNGAKINSGVNTPLLSAANNGNVEVVETLIKAKAKLPKIDEKLCNDFCTAAEIGNLPITRCFVLLGVPVDFVDNNNYTPLLLAASKGHLKVVEFLIEKGANIHHVDQYGNSALILSTFGGYFETVKYLIKKESKINVENKLGNRALSIAIDNYFLFLSNRRNDLKKIGKYRADLFSKAVVSGNLNEVKKWLSRRVDVNAPDQYGNTPLLEAALNDDVAMVKLLIENDADVNYKDSLGQSVMSKVKQVKCLNVFDYLIQEFPNFENSQQNENVLLLNRSSARYQTTDYLINNQNNDNESDDEENKKKLEAKFNIVSTLIEMGAEVNCLDCDGRTPLSRAACRSLDLVQKLVERGADINKVDSNKSTALFYAVDGNNLEIVRYLVDENIDINAPNIIGETALARAAKRGFLSIVEFLISKNADLETIDDNGDSPLSNAAEFNHHATLKFLTQKTDNINLGSPLLKAVRSQHFSIVEELLERGAVVDGSVMLAARNHPDMFRILSQFFQDEIPVAFEEIDLEQIDHNGYRPLSSAVLEGNFNLVQHLVGRGAEIDWVDPQGFTALGLAVKKAHFATAKFLVENGASIKTVEHLIPRAGLRDTNFYHLLKKYL